MRTEEKKNKFNASAGLIHHLRRTDTVLLSPLVTLAVMGCDGIVAVVVVDSSSNCRSCYYISTRRFFPLALPLPEPAIFRSPFQPWHGRLVVHFFSRLTICAIDWMLSRNFIMPAHCSFDVDHLPHLLLFFRHAFLIFQFSCVSTNEHRVLHVFSFNNVFISPANGNPNTLVFLFCSHARFPSSVSCLLSFLFAVVRKQKKNKCFHLMRWQYERAGVRREKKNCDHRAVDILVKLKVNSFFFRRLRVFQPHSFLFSFISFSIKCLSGRSWEIKCGKYRSCVVHHNPLHNSAAGTLSMCRRQNTTHWLCALELFSQQQQHQRRRRRPEEFIFRSLFLIWRN